MAFDFDTPIDRAGTQSLKWDIYKGRDIIPAWVADMDFASPPAVIEALQQRSAHGIFGYTLEDPALTNVIVERLDQLYHWKIEPEWIVWLPGLVCGINLCCHAVGQKGDSIITHSPVYPPFLSAPNNSEKKVIKVPMNLNPEDNQWTIDFDQLESATTKETKLYLLCNPHNPAGRVFSAEELSELAAWAKRHNIVICSDEIHCDLILDNLKHVPFASLDEEISAQTITLMAPSKTFNLAGIGLSFAIVSDPKLRTRLQRAQQGLVPHPNLFGYTAALAAYQHGQAWLDELLTYLRNNRDITYEQINSIDGLSMVRPQATYLGWIDTRDRKIDQPGKYFESHGIGLSDGAPFGGKGFVRINYGCPKSQLETALERIEAALK